MSGERGRSVPMVRLLAVGMVAVFIIRTAWVSGDGLVELRTVANVVDGYGLSWNVGERVQTFVDPSWILILGAASSVTHEVLFTAIVVSILLAAAAVAIVAATAVSSSAAAVAVLGLGASTTFVDYATSGLSTPLTYLLLAWLVWSHTRGHVNRVWFACWTGVVLLTQPLAVLIVGPSAVWHARRCREPVVKVLAALLMPFVAWEVFAWLYFGTPVPNPVRAWLNQPHPAGAMAAAGLVALRDWTRADPVGAVLVASMVAWHLARRSAQTMIVVGVVLYMVTVIAIGEGSSDGRLSAPVIVVCAMLVAQIPWRHFTASAAVIVLAALGLTAAHPVLTSGASFGGPASPGQDDRWTMYARTGLLRASRPTPIPWAPDIQQRADLALSEGLVVVTEDIGLTGFLARGTVHVLDPRGRTDPLLARLRPAGPWQPGVMRREIPQGYVEWLEGRGAIRDPRIAALQARVARQTHAVIPPRRRAEKQ